jgi:hypothetical protein
MSPFMTSVEQKHMLSKATSLKNVHDDDSRKAIIYIFLWLYYFLPQKQPQYWSGSLVPLIGEPVLDMTTNDLSINSI